MRTLPLITILLLCVSACGGLPDDLMECPDDSTVTWAEAGPVFEANCTRCHSSTLVGLTDRQGAADTSNYDTVEFARVNADQTWTRISGSDGQTTMPNDADFTSTDDALIVHEWLSCGGPE